MATLFMDGFEHYGSGNMAANNGSVYNALLSGVYAQVPNLTTAGIGTPAWGARTGSLAAFNSDDPTGFRLVLPTSEAGEFWTSIGWSIDQLPAQGPGRYTICAFRNGSNNIIAYLAVETTGALSIYGANNTDLLGETDGPVVAAGTWYQILINFDAASGCYVYVNGTPVLENVSGYTDNSIAQLSFLGGPDTVQTPIATQWMDDLYINDTTGTLNNSQPAGDIFVTLLEPDVDLTPNGWTANPRQLFGSGILDVSQNDTFGQQSSPSVTTPMGSTLDLGSGDFTAEGWFRWAALPTGTNVQHMLGAWDVGTSLAYQLALCGPGLNNGNIVWRITTDGTSGTTQNIINWPFIPNTDTWYHIAVSRVSGETMLFINGVQQGPAIADANTYFAETAGKFGIAGPGFVADGAYWFAGWVEEVRLTVGVGRYNANFAPPVAEFPVGAGSDPDWTSVQLLANFDGTAINDLSNATRVLTANNGAVAIEPSDGAHKWQVINKPLGPLDDTFIAAPELQATAIYTQTAQPADGDTVTVATKDGMAAAVYRFKNAMTQAYDVKIGANLQTTLSNLAAAINAGPGSGTAYFAGTLVNNDVTALQLPLEQVEVTANIAGTGGNALACSAVSAGANGSWNGTHLSGGTGIPAASTFAFTRPPPNTTLVQAIQVVTRQYKTDSGTCQTQVSVIGALGGSENGALYDPSTNPSFHNDIFDANPDGAGAWTPTAIVGMSIQINRTE